MTLPVFYVRAQSLDVGEYVAAETREKARAMSTRNARGAGWEVRYVDMRAVRALNGIEPITVDVCRARGLATYEVEAYDRRNPVQVRVRIDPGRERAERRLAGLTS